MEQDTHREGAGYAPESGAAPAGDEESFADSRALRRANPRRRLVSVGAGVAVVAIAVTGALTYKGLSNSGHGGGVPVVQADSTPLKVAPKVADGVEIPDQNRQIYDPKGKKDGQIKIAEPRGAAPRRGRGRAGRSGPVAADRCPGRHDAGQRPVRGVRGAPPRPHRRGQARGTARAAAARAAGRRCRTGPDPHHGPRPATSRRRRRPRSPSPSARPPPPCRRPRPHPSTRSRRPRSSSRRPSRWP
ncbi:hypothetical protein ACU4GA_02465 [Methylobacterium oryzae CBMB20]